MTPNSALNIILGGHGATCDAGIAPCKRCDREHEAAEVLRALISSATRPAPEQVPTGEVTEEHLIVMSKCSDDFMRHTLVWDGKSQPPSVLRMQAEVLASREAAAYAKGLANAAEPWEALACWQLQSSRNELVILGDEPPCMARSIDGDSQDDTESSGATFTKAARSLCIKLGLLKGPGT